MGHLVPHYTSLNYVYGPISLLSTVGNVLEKLIHKNVFNSLRDHAILTLLQSGFIPGDSTVNQLSFAKHWMKTKKFMLFFVIYVKL